MGFKMDTDVTNSVDCTIMVRKYLLIPTPSKMGRKGGRVVVQSPMLELLTTHSTVPVRGFQGSQENCVRYHPKTDIERDKEVYKKNLVSDTPVRISAHGVAITKSSANETLVYAPGDRFWVMMEKPTDMKLDTVQAINLRTFEYGFILLHHICWFPTMQGQDNELYTLCGEPRERLYSRHKKTIFTWAICQKLDGTMASNTHVELPSSDGNEKVHKLSQKTSNRLFQERLLAMKYHAPKLDPRPATPQDQREPLYISDSQSESSHTSHLPQAYASSADFALVLVDMLQKSRAKAIKSRFSGEQQTYEPAFSSAFPEVVADCTIISAAHNIDKLSDNGWYSASTFAFNARLCDLRDSTCKYSSQFPEPHFHSSPFKCQKRNKEVHEHCISRTAAFPGRLGDCILETMPSKNHQCCYWNEEDLEALPHIPQPFCDHARLEKEKRVGMEFYDRTDQILEMPMACPSPLFDPSIADEAAQLLACETLEFDYL